jgi:hypothetical protein
MSFFRRLFGLSQARILAPGRGWTTEVVGELQCQADIERQYRLHGGTEHDAKATATLIPEDNNEYDANAVRVEIGGRLVGYLPRERAAEYRSAVGTASSRCGAKMVGGFVLDDDTRERAYFGVKLNIAWPPRFRL